MSNNYRIFALLSLSVALIYMQSLSYIFLWDDVLIHLHNNPHLNPAQAESVLDLWQAPYRGMYVPVTYSVWAALSLLSDTLTAEAFNTVVFRGFNLVVHLGNGLLIWRLLRFLDFQKAAAFIAALLFLIHPIQVESVVWASELRTLLAFHFGLAAMLVFLHFQQQPKRYVLYLAAIVLFGLAMMSKPSASVIPLMLMAYAWWSRALSLKTSTLTLLPWAIVAACLVFITHQAQTLDNDLTLSAWQRLILLPASVNFYLYQLVFPTQLSASYGLSPEQFLQTLWPWTGYIWILIAGLLWRFRLWHTPAVLGLLWFIIGVLPTAGLTDFVFMHWSLVADRYAYFGMLGASIALASLMQWNGHRLIRPVLYTVLGLLGLLSAFVQVPTWQHPLTLWNHAILQEPINPLAYNNRAGAYVSLGQWDQAATDLAISRLLSKPPKAPRDYQPYIVQRLVHGYSLVQIRSVIESTQTATHPPFSMLRANLAFRTGDQAQAVALIKQSLSSHPDAFAQHLFETSSGFKSLSKQQQTALIEQYMLKHWAQTQPPLTAPIRPKGGLEKP